MLCISIAAQIGTMPLIIYYFGRISCYALFTSFIAIPAATVILWLSAAILLLTLLTHIPLMSLLSEPLLHFAASGLISITQATNTALKLTTMLPGASIDGIKINIPQLCLIYFCIIVGYIFINQEDKVLFKNLIYSIFSKIILFSLLTTRIIIFRKIKLCHWIYT